MKISYVLIIMFDCLVNLTIYSKELNKFIIYDKPKTIIINKTFS